MHHATFPYLDVPVSRIGFGAFGLGGVFGAFDESEAIAALHLCWERGVNFLDTARHYGASESIIGKALKAWSGPRPFIASKAETIGPREQWGAPRPVDVCFPKGHITREAEASLRALGVDSIDLYQMHLYWPNWGVEGYWLDELESLRATGKIRSFGVSLPDQRHDAGLPLVLSGRIHSVQTVFNIFDPTPLDCLIPLCRENDVAVIARCVLDEGGLAGTLKKDTAFQEGDFRARYFDMGPRETYIAKVDALRKFIPDQASSLASLALKFVLKDPGVTTAVSSMHLKPHAEENIRAADEPPLSDEAFDTLYRHHRWIRNFYHPKVF
ncbi:MAG: aldo/keto reductase [Chthoniobacteraceae bacterium]|nr:aldo/keto reductase [Chthoniobacteraceae bacterium]